MGVGARGRLKGHGADGAFIENLTVSALDVRLESSDVRVDHTTVHAAGGQGEKRNRPF